MTDLVSAQGLQQGDMIWYGPYTYEVENADNTTRQGYTILDLALDGEHVLSGWAVPQVQAFDRAPKGKVDG